ncbi:MAG: hypothetical protein U5K69_11735 [Balneolaceae bacterium]|nr:hypothetical protein [Balneolaceae bacterium]
MEKLTLNLPVLLPDIPDVEDKCVSRLIGTLEGREGVLQAHIKSNGEPTSQLCIHFDPDVITLHRIKSLARQAGAQLQDTFGHLLIEVKGIRHARQARTITRRLQQLEGVVDAYAGATGWIRVEYNRNMAGENALLDIIEEMGLTIQQIANGYQYDDAHITLIDNEYDPSNREVSSKRKRKTRDKSPEKDIDEHGPDKVAKTEEEYTKHKHSHEAEEHGEHDHAHDHGGIFGEKTELIFSLICGGLLAVGFGLSYVSVVPGWIPLALYVGSYFFGGYYITQEAWTEVRQGNFEIDFLMLVAAIGAAILGEWAEGALLLFLFSLGHSLEHYAMGRARDAIKGLADLAPKTALSKNERRHRRSSRRKAAGRRCDCHPAQQQNIGRRYCH